MLEPANNESPGLIDRAFDLAEQGRGTALPNPMVGAVIVSNGKVVGEGYHRRAGGPHAEVVAIEAAGGETNGSILYVSLEPCVHQGRTPPCVEAIIAAGISRVVVGAVDPNPAVAGQGVECLRKAGIDVELTGRDKDFKRQNEAFVKYITTGKPFVMLKAAISLDGKIAAAVDQKTEITGPKAQHEVHILRSQHQAVIVGVGTVLVDDPMLNCRLGGPRVRQPLRVVVDSGGRLPLSSKLAISAGDWPTAVAVTEKAAAANLNKLREMGVDVIVCRSRADGKVDVADLLIQLGRREIAAVVIEGGGRLNRTVLAQNLVDKLTVFLAPVVLGAEGVDVVAGEGAVDFQFKWAESRLVGDDIMITGYRQER